MLRKTAEKRVKAFLTLGATTSSMSSLIPENNLTVVVWVRSGRGMLPCAK